MWRSEGMIASFLNALRDAMRPGQHLRCLRDAMRPGRPPKKVNAESQTGMWRSEGMIASLPTYRAREASPFDMYVNEGVLYHKGKIAPEGTAVATDDIKGLYYYGTITSSSETYHLVMMMANNLGALFYLAHDTEDDKGRRNFDFIEKRWRREGEIGAFLRREYQIVEDSMIGLAVSVWVNNKKRSSKPPEFFVSDGNRNKWKIQ